MLKPELTEEIIQLIFDSDIDFYGDDVAEKIALILDINILDALYLWDEFSRRFID